MKELLKKEQIFTIPNILSFLRILMVPLLVWLYCGCKNYYMAIAVLILSGLTDIVDGIIARKCNMISDLGKILDPFADKLTQVSLLICLATKYKMMVPLIVLFVLKEVMQAILAYIAVKNQDKVYSAKWYGKLNTVVIYSVIFILILMPDIPKKIINVMILSTILMMAISFIMYTRFFRKVKKD